MIGTLRNFRTWVSVSAILALSALPAAPSEESVERDTALATAVQQLVEAEYALDTARRDYEQAQTEEDLSKQERKEFENFLQSLEKSVGRACQKVDRLGGDVADRNACEQTKGSGPVAAPARAQSDQERLAAIDTELNRSVGEFDQMLQREQLDLEASASNPNAAQQSGQQGGGQQGGQAGQQGQQGGQSGGQAGGRQGQQGRQGTLPRAEGQQAGQGQQGGNQQAGGQQGQQGGQAGGQAGRQGQQAGEQGGAQGQQQAGQQQAGQMPSGPGGSVGPQGGQAQGPRGSAGPSGGRGAEIPDDVPSGQDDDIVAQQLREAAENETDPELRARLWEEYRRYKEGQDQ